MVNNRDDSSHVSAAQSRILQPGRYVASGASARNENEHNMRLLVEAVTSPRESAHSTRGVKRAAPDGSNDNHEERMKRFKYTSVPNEGSPTASEMVGVVPDEGKDKRNPSLDLPRKDHSHNVDCDHDDDVEEEEAILSTKNENGFTRTFPQRLMEVLSRKDTLSAIVWMPDGMSFIILSPRAFVAAVLPKFFKQTKFASFTRKLNRWGFKRITKGANAGAYFHKLFQRDKPDLCLQMCCQKSGEAPESASDGGGNPPPASSGCGQPLPGDAIGQLLHDQARAAAESLALRRQSLELACRMPPASGMNAMGAPQRPLLGVTTMSDDPYQALLRPECFRSGTNAGQLSFPPRLPPQDVSASLNRQQLMAQLGDNLASPSVFSRGGRGGMLQSLPSHPVAPPSSMITILRRQQQQLRAQQQQLQALQIANRRLSLASGDTNIPGRMSNNNNIFGMSRAQMPSSATLPNGSDACAAGLRGQPGRLMAQFEDVVADKASSSMIIRNPPNQATNPESRTKAARQA